MCYLWHRLRIFSFFRSYVPSSRYSSFCILTITWFTQSVMSWWVLVHDTFFNISFEQQLIKSPNLVNCWYKPGQKLWGIFWTIWGTGAKFQDLFNFVVCSNYLITSYVKTPVFHFFEKMNRGQLKKINVNY